MTEPTSTSTPSGPAAASAVPPAALGPAAGAPEGSTMTEIPSSPHDAPPTWAPGLSSPVAPEAPRSRVRQRLGAFRRQVVKLWPVLVVGAACLIVGLGFGVLIGHETSGSGGSGQPSFGSNQGPGQGFGRRDFDGQGPSRPGNDLGQGQGSGQGSGAQAGSGTASGTTTSTLGS